MPALFFNPLTKNTINIKLKKRQPLERLAGYAASMAPNKKFEVQATAPEL